jgi:hypothetical protein
LTSALQYPCSGSSFGVSIWILGSTITGGTLNTSFDSATSSSLGAGEPCVILAVTTISSITGSEAAAAPNTVSSTAPIDNPTRVFIVLLRLSNNPRFTTQMLRSR